MHLDPLGEGELAQLVVDGRRQVDSLLDRRLRGPKGGTGSAAGPSRRRDGAVTTPLRTVLRCFIAPSPYPVAPLRKGKGRGVMAFPLELGVDPLPRLRISVAAAPLR